jgi:murein DD-endopeptidase MepM/ murein hydrolase activator NlpD
MRLKSSPPIPPYRKVSRTLLAGVAAWLLLSLACNYPGLPTRQPGLSGEDLRATIEAPAASAGQVPTSVPGITMTSPAPTPPSTPAAAAGVSKLSPPESDGSVFRYRVQSGDTLPALASHFGVSPDQIGASQALPAEALLPPGQLLEIPVVLGDYLDARPLLPDSEVIFSPSAADFDIGEYVRQAGGYLSTFQETVQGETLSGVEIVERTAVELSINPRLLLALLEYRSGWVRGRPQNVDEAHPLGLFVPDNRGLSRELSIAATQLNVGYYGWRLGTLTEIKFQDGRRGRLAPGLNAGSAALQHLFARISKSDPWREALYGSRNFLVVYTDMFGDPWERAARVEPLFPDNVAQPALELPFRTGERWSFTGGPHASWNTGTPNGALDFSPVTGEGACAPSSAWVTASAAGVVTRSENAIVVIDLDGDGHEATGWTLLYMHVPDKDRIQAGARVEVNQPIGHPSCERGRSTGTHVHIARKYQGEWLPAAGALPFNLSGWEAQAGKRIYEGELVKDGQSVFANPGGPQTSIIIR